MALSKLTKVQTLGIGSNIEVVGVITTGQFKSGTSNLHSSGVELTNLNVSGIATIGGNVSIGGTLTYQDVTNIDSVGIITARSNIDCNGDLDVDGHTNLDNVSIAGVTTTTDNINIDADNKKLQIGDGQDLQLFHNGSQSHINNSTGILKITGANGQKIDFVDASNGYYARFNSGNSCELHYVGSGAKIMTASYGAQIIGNVRASTGGDGYTFINDSDTGMHNPSDGNLHFKVNGSDKLTINNAGEIDINTGSGTQGLHFQASSGANANLRGVGARYGELGFFMGNSEKVRLDANGRLLVGTTSTNSAVRAVFQGYYGGGDDFQARVQFQTNQATNLALNQHLANLLFTNSSGSVGAEIRAIADGAWGTNDYPGRLEFYTTPDGSNTSTERMRLQSNGYMALNTTGAQRLFSVKESNNKASILIWRTSESNADYSGIDFIGHPSNNGTNYQKGGIYWQTDGSGFGRGDMVFCNDGAADADNVIISNEKLRIHKEGPVTKPNMPVASFTDSRATDISNAVLTSSNFYNHQWWNEGNHFNTSNGRFTCPVDGVYRLYFRASEQDTTSTNVRLRKNGNTINEAYTKSGNHSVSSEIVLHCSANDYLEIQANRLKANAGTQHKQVTFQLLH